MTKLFGFGQAQGVKAPIYASLLSLTMDSNAERFILIDRRNLMVLYAGLKPPSKVAKVLLPQELATGHYCIVGIADDDGVYDCKFTDGLMLELVDANTVNMSQ
ncbi:hypothetical protein [Shewanella mangrovisoli]|uniref:hypothetical protein n=1 Tax=Shewanella mangrovisoli TaxID=2864211 RepID=UPI0035B8DF12